MSTVPENLDQIFNNWKPKWYYQWFPFLPRFVNNKELQRFTVSWRDCSYTEKSVGRPHFFDLLVANHKSPWYKARLAGVQIWY